MPPRKVLARGWVFEVESATPDTWIQIGGINNFTPDRAKDDADTSDFDSGGWAEHLPASRGLSISLDGFYLEDAAGARDLGQARVEALAQLVDNAGLGRFRMTSPATGGNRRVTGDVSFNYGGPGGGNNDGSAWSMVATFSGQPTIGA